MHHHYEMLAAGREVQPIAMSRLRQTYSALPMMYVTILKKLSEPQ
jgi:hypothetical protein